MHTYPMEGEAWEELLQNCQNDSEYLHSLRLCPGEVFEGWMSGWMDGWMGGVWGRRVEVADRWMRRGEDGW